MGGSGNKMIPILGALGVIFMLLVFVKSGKDTAKTSPGAPRTAPSPDADTAADTIRSMAAQMAEVKKQAEQSKRDAEQARAQQSDEMARLKSEMQAEQNRQRQSQDTSELSRRLDELSKRLAQTPQAPAGQPELPIGGPAASAENGLVWVEPLDHKGLPGLPNQQAALAPVATAGQNQSVLHPAAEAPAKPKPDEPAFTVPRNATLVGSTAMTALIGRVPIKGQVEDPFPFKVLVGRDNLAANGLEVPGVFGMVFSGTAFGDWTLSCVRGHVDSVTFVFEDGRTRTISADAQGGGGSASAGAGGASYSGSSGTGNAASTIHKGLGWISDRRGIPCVTGKRISNAVDYLAGRMLAKGIETAGKAYARAQQTINTTPLGGVTSAVTGNSAQYALGETAAGGSSELAQFIAERQAQMFDVIYVDTGAEVAVHVDREIPIDYQPNGRKLDYARETLREPGRGGLD